MPPRRVPILFRQLAWVCFSVLCAAAGLRAQDAAAQPGFFTRELYPVMEKANCRGCHNPNGVASATRLHFPDPGAAPAAIEAFGKSLVVLVDQIDPARSLLLNKPTLRIPHTGGKRIPPGSPGEKPLIAWVHHLAGLSPEEAAAARRGLDAPVARVRRAPVLRRLTHSQYNNTVRDLLGDESNPADQFPPEDFVNGYKGQFQSQDIGPLLADAYSAAAEKLARSAFRGGDQQGLVPCRPAAAADADCAARFVRSFGLRAFRRPLLADEQGRYAALLAAEASRGGSFNAGAQAVVEAMLQSPSFLFRVEDGVEPRWAAYEAASRLSYFLWDSMPDAALFRDAETGALNTPSGFEQAARRMLASPNAHRAVDEFVAEWLRFDRLLNTVKDRRTFPQYTPELGLAMTEETRRFVSDLVWSDRSFLDLFTANYSFLNGDLAAVYGLPAPAGDFDRVEFPAASDRAGIIGQATFLALTSKPAETSPTARGLFVREQFLCQHVPDPPPGVNANLPPITDAKPMTNRQRLSQLHLTSQMCAGCHNLIDPIGFGLEKFDAIGGRQDKLKLTFYPGHNDPKGSKPKHVELDLDASGNVAGIANSAFSSPRQLGAVLAASSQCQLCLVNQLFRYAMGRPETAADRTVIGRVFDDFRRSNFRFRELMLSLMKWTQFPPGRANGPDTKSD